MISSIILSGIGVLATTLVAAQSPVSISNPSATLPEIPCQTTSRGRYYPAEINCTPVLDPSTDDDTPALQAAIQRAGNNTGYVVIPSNMSLTLKSPVLWEKCQWCGLKNSGTIKIAGGKSWEGVKGVLSAWNTIQWRMDSPGVIDASYLRLASDADTPPALFHGFNMDHLWSTGMNLKNAPGTYLRLEKVSYISAQTISILSEKGYGRDDAYGIVMGGGEYVFWDHIDIKNEGERTGNCIAIDGVPEHGTTIRNTTCVNTLTGVTVLLGASETRYTVNGLVNASHIRVTDLTVDADIATGVLNKGFQRAAVSDVFFGNVTVLNGDAAVVEDCWAGPGKTGQCDQTKNSQEEPLRTYTGITFKDYKGKLGAPPRNRTGTVVVDVRVENWGF